MRRRTLLIGGAALVALGAATWIFWPDDEDQGVPVSLGWPRLTLPLIRATIAGQDRLFMLVRRSETETGAEVPAGAGWRGERLEIRAYDAASLAPVFAAPVISGRGGGFRTAGLIGEQAATLWLYGTGLGAASAVDGQVFLGGEGFAAVTPQLTGAFNQPREVYRMEEALVLTSLGSRFRLNPRSFAGTAAPDRDQGRTDAAFPPPTLPAPFDAAGGPGAFRVPEASLGDIWFGLPFANADLQDGQPQGANARFIPLADTRGAAQRLWRAGTRRGVPPVMGPGGFQGSIGGGEALLLDRPAAVTLEAAAPRYAGFLTAGTPAPLRPPGSPGLFLLQQADIAAPLVLRRLGEDGRALWTATLSFPRLISVLPGAATLVLVGQRGSGPAEQDIIVAVALADGQMKELILNYGGAG
ncbi:MAG TPA: hypothetical protein VGM87_00850 [Roseomonas sp.]|jgi:hypothetical protein